jgi:hypothetical protein
MALWKSITVERPGRTLAVCTVTLGALAFTACSSAHEDQGGTKGGAGVGAHAGQGGTGGGGTGGGSGTGGTLSIINGGSAGSGAAATTPTGGTGGTLTPYLSPESGLLDPNIAEGGSCATANADVGVFCEQIVWNVAPAHRVLYSWTTAEQAAELRQDHVLLTRTETAGLGRGYAFTSIDELAARGDAPENHLLTKLSEELFTKVRYAWPNAWATRMGWPGEDYGDQLLRIVLKPNAWIMVVSDRVGIAVIDLDNHLVPIADAVAQSERIGAVYFYKRDITGNGSFETCSGGYREFIVGNEAMVEEWSLGTAQIRDQISADATLIERFMTDTRDMPPGIAPKAFNQYAVCSWDGSAQSELDGYVHALSIPSEYYAPLPAELAALADTLRQSLFEPDPLTVKPGG